MDREGKVFDSFTTENPLRPPFFNVGGYFAPKNTMIVEAPEKRKGKHKDHKL